MALGDFLKKKADDAGPDELREAAEQYARRAQTFAEGRMQASWKMVALITLSEEVRQWLRERLAPALKERGYLLLDQATAEQAVDAAAVLLDVTPKGDSRLHDHYDKILRMKKSLAKRDVMAVFGRREDHKRYPRGTWPGLLFFCLKDGQPEAREADLPPEGADTVVGPRLFNFADLPVALAARLDAAK